MASLSIDDVSIKSDKLLNSSYLMQNYSTVTVTVATAKRCILTIKNENGVLAQTISSNSITFVPSVAGTFWIQVTTKDSSGATETLSTEGKKTFTVLPYFKPQITEFTCVRDASGNNVTATIKGIVANVEINNSQLNSCGASATLNGETVALGEDAYTTSEDLRTINGSVVFKGVSNETLIFTAKVSDSLNTVIQEYVLPTEAVTMDFHYSGRGAAFGKVAEEENLLEVKWNAKVHGKLLDADDNDLFYDSGWQKVNYNEAYFGDYATSQQVKYRRVGKQAYIRGSIKPKQTIATSSGPTLFTLPEGFRPTQAEHFLCTGASSNTWLCTVKSTGDVTVSDYTSSSGNVSENSRLTLSVSFLVG